MAFYNDSSGVPSGFQQLTHQDDRRRATLADFKSRFAGRADEDVFLFVSRVEHYMAASDITDEEALKQLPLLLDGVAAKWWRCFRPHIHSWDEAKSKIQEHFRHGKSTMVEQRRPRESAIPGVFIDDDRWQWVDLTKCPKRFSGAEDENVLDFIEDLELYISAKRIPLETALQQLGLLLKGHDATMWWADIRGSIKTWEQAKTELCKRFGYARRPIILSDLVLSEVRQRRQQPHERAIDYIISICSIMRKMNPPLDDSLQVGYITQGLRPSIARRMICKDKLSPLQLTSEIIQVEESLKRISNKK